MYHLLANAEIFRKHSKVNWILVSSISKRVKLFLFIIYIQIVIMTNISGRSLGLLVMSSFFVNKYYFLMHIKTRLQKYIYIMHFSPSFSKFLHLSLNMKIFDSSIFVSWHLALPQMGEIKASFDQCTQNSGKKIPGTISIYIEFRVIFLSVAIFFL